MWLAKPAKLQFEEGQVRPMCDDKKCQSTKLIQCMITRVVNQPNV